MKKIQVLAVAVHPDDAELCCSGTLMMEKLQGKSIGVIDLTRGELGTRGTPELRATESEAAGRRGGTKGVPARLDSLRRVEQMAGGKRQGWKRRTRQRCAMILG